MLYFENDYCEGAHPAILQKLTETNFEKVSGYGTDPYCASAREKIRQACRCPEAEVEFLVGGTQTNAVVISSMLRDWEGVVAARTGHISVAFFTPSCSAKDTSPSWMVSSVHWGRASSMGIAASSMVLQTSGFVLDFLLVKNSIS